MIAHSERQLQYGIEIRNEINRLFDYAETIIKTNPPKIIELSDFYLYDLKKLRDKINTIAYASEIIEKYKIIMNYNNDYKKFFQLWNTDRDFKISPITYTYIVLKKYNNKGELNYEQN